MKKQIIIKLLVILLLLPVYFPVNDEANAEDYGDLSLGYIQNFTISYDGEKIRLIWDELEGADYYVVYRKKGKNGNYEIIENLYSHATQDYNVQIGESYSYYVRAAKDSGVVIYSNQSEVLDITVPILEPTNLAVIEKKVDEVTFTWDEIYGIPYYEVYGSNTRDGDYTLINWIETNQFTHVHANNGDYFYKVRALTSEFIPGEFSEPLHVTFSFHAPKDLAVSQKTATTVSLKWSPVEEAAEYEIWQATSKNGHYVSIGTTATTTYTTKKLEPNKTYYFKIRAVTKHAEKYSAFSEIVSAQLKFTAPSALKVKENAVTSITLNWAKVEGAQGYEIYRATSKSGTYKKIATVNATSYSDKSLTTNKTYYYKVRAYASNKTVFSPYSTVVSGKTVLNPPIKLKIPTKTPNSLKLTWEKVTGVTGYEVWRSDKSNGKYTKVASTKSNVFTQANLTFNKTYYYKVRSYVTSNNKTTYSAYTQVVNGKTALAAVSNLKISATSSVINLSWAKVSGADAYKVYRATSANGTYTLVGTVTNLSYSDKNATKFKTYYYKVIASKKVNKNLVSGPSSAIVNKAITEVLEPKFSVYIEGNTNQNTAYVGFEITNKGSKTMRIKKVGYLIDKDYASFDRELNLFDGKTYKSIAWLDVPKNTGSTVWFKVIGSNTWYDKNTIIIFEFSYDGVDYYGYIGYTYGAYYQRK